MYGSKEQSLACPVISVSFITEQIATDVLKSTCTYDFSFLVNLHINFIETLALHIENPLVNQNYKIFNIIFYILHVYHRILVEGVASQPETNIR